MGNASAGQIFGYVAVGIAALGLLGLTIRNLKHYTMNNDKLKNHTGAIGLHILGFLALAGIATAIWHFLHKATSRQKELADLISKDMTHFFGRVTDSTTNVRLSEEVANKAIDECKFDTSQLSKAITQVTDDKQDGAEYIKLFAQLGKAYTAGTVWRRGDDPDATLLGYY